MAPRALPHYTTYERYKKVFVYIQSLFALALALDTPTKEFSE